MLQGLGQDDRVLAQDDRAGKIINFRWNPEGWWDNDRGWEPMVPYGNSYEYPDDALAPVRGLWIWSRHEGAEVYYLFERNGILQIEYGNDNDLPFTARVQLETGRHEPGPGEPGTQFAPCGRWALLLNGYDAPRKYWGRELLTAFSFAATPPPPTVVGVEPEALGTGVDEATGRGIAVGATCIGGLTAGLISPGGWLGFGGVDDGPSTYRYRVSWVTDTGAESPLSQDAMVTWKTDPLENPLEPGTYAVWLANLPTGPDNVVAWRVYRTKNLGSQDQVEDRQFYFVAEVPYTEAGNYVDTAADARLTILAPSFGASTVLPPGLRYATVFDGRMWLGGGANAPSRLWYSERGLPEQFGAFNYIDLGTLECGDITQLAAFQGGLYVFRERGIDVVVVLDNGTAYRVVNVDPNVGTVASNTVRAVPGMGLLFLGRAGVYCVSGTTLRHCSRELAEEWRRAASGSMARAWATYSSREGEYWVQYPADGGAENSRGAVLHVQLSTPERYVWSMRNVAKEAWGEDAAAYRLVVTCLAADPNGWIIMGTAPVNLTTGNYPGQAQYADLATDAEVIGVGLQVWSAAPYAGKLLTVTAVGETWTATQSERTAMQSVFQSAWLEFDGRALVHKIEVWLLNTGRPDITCEVAVNGREEWTDVSQSIEAAPAETAKTSDNDHLYGVSAVAAKYGYRATWGSSLWREDRLVRAVWAVAVPQRAVTSFAFRLRTRDHIGIAAYKVHANPIGVPTQSQIGRSGGA